MKNTGDTAYTKPINSPEDWASDLKLHRKHSSVSSTFSIDSNNTQLSNSNIHSELTNEELGSPFPIGEHKVNLKPQEKIDFHIQNLRMPPKRCASLSDNHLLFFKREGLNRDPLIEPTARLFELSDHLLEAILRQNYAYDEWYEPLRKIVVEYIKKAQVDLLYSNLSSKETKIKRVLHRDQSLCKLIKGIVIRRTLESKHSKEDFSQLNPTILMIKGNLEEGSHEIRKLEVFALNQNKLNIDELVNRIISLKPHVVIVQGKVGQKASSLFLKSNIVIVPEIKESKFNELAQTLAIIPFQELSKPHLISSCNIGNCQRFSLVNTQTMSANKVNCRTLLYFEEYKPCKNSCIVISGPELDKLSLPKACLKKIFFIIRTLLIEREIVDQDRWLFKSQERALKLNMSGPSIFVSEDPVNDNLTKSAMELLYKSSKATAGFLYYYSPRQLSLERILTPPNITFTHFMLGVLDFEKNADLANRNAKERQQFEDNLKHSQCWGRQSLCQLEREPQLMEPCLWGENDTTLGRYLTKKAARASELCKTCSQRQCTHVHFFAFCRSYIKITSNFGQRKRKQSAITSGKNKYQLNIAQASESVMDFFGTLLSPRKSSHVEKRRMSGSSTGSGNEAVSSTKKKSISISMHIECTGCGSRISEPVKLKTNALEYSFSLFLRCMIDSAQNNSEYFEEKSKFGCKFAEKEIEDILKNKPFKTSTSSLKPCCIASAKARVFIVDNLHIKFTVGHLNPATLHRVSYTCPKVLEQVSIVQNGIIANKYAQFKQLQNNIFELLITSWTKILCFLIDSNLVSPLSKPKLNQSPRMKDKSPQSYISCQLLLVEINTIGQSLVYLLQQGNNNIQRKLLHHFDLDKQKKELYDNLCLFAKTLQESKKVLLTLIQKISRKKNQDQTANQQNSKSSTGQQCTSLDKLKIFNLQNVQNNILEMIQEVVMKLNPLDKSQSQGKIIEKETQAMKALIEGLSPPYHNIGNCEDLKYPYLPIWEDQPPSFIAYALNSPEYMKDVHKQAFNGLEAHSQGKESQLDKLRQHFNPKFEAQSLTESKPFALKVSSYDFETSYPNRILTSIYEEMIDLQDKKSNDNIDLMDFVFKFIDSGTHKEENESEKFKTSEYKISCYYPNQFEALRAVNNINLADYISSLSSSQNWKDNTGGKTGAKFIKTTDQRFVLKEIEKKEFLMLLEFSTSYLKYAWEACSQKQKSLLVRFYGLYEVCDKKCRYFVVMENLFFGMTGDLKVYDLKGSELNRYVNKIEGEKRTLLDTNYKVDRNGEPLPVKIESCCFINRAVENDAEFLAANKKIDYSLLLIHDERNNIIRVGIIDFLRNYDLEKQIEHVGKLIINNGTVPTITRPEEYKERFCTAMKRYFMPVNNT